MLRRAGRGQSGGMGVNGVGAQRGWGGSVRTVAPGSAPSCSGREQPRWMDGAKRSLWGPSSTPLRVRGLSAGGDACGWAGTLLVAVVPVICETNLHPCSMGRALACPAARLGSWAMGPQSPRSCPEPALLPAAELSSTKPRPVWGHCFPLCGNHQRTSFFPLLPPGGGCSIPWDRRHVSTG